jgi:aminopeptidase N
MNLTKSDRVYNRHDQSSFSNPSLAVSTSIHLEWTLDFGKQHISGSCKHSVTVVVSGTEDVDFDSSKLIIDSVTINNVTASYKVADADPQLGSKISVRIPEVIISDC